MKRLGLIAVFLCFAAMLFAQQDLQVNAEELKKTQKEITFENYSGPVTQMNSREQIRSIGRDIATARLDKNGNIVLNKTVGDKTRYALREIADLGEPGKRPREQGLSADIIELGRNAGVDHIRNLREILAGYLEEAYHYSPEDANELAIYITVYNVTKRNRIDAFTGIYSKSVLMYLDKNKIGLADSYKDWRGKTQIVIPLYDPNGDGTFFVEPSTLLDDEVITSLKKENDDTALVAKAVAAKKQAEDIKAESDRRIAKAKEDRETNARDAVKKAEDELAWLRRAIAEAEEKQITDGARLRKGKEELELLRLEFERANKEVVRNKFGEPIQGNETAKAKEAELKRHQEMLVRLEKSLVSGETLIEDLNRQLEEAIANSNQRLHELQNLDL
jgi:hypothetical protein